MLIKILLELLGPIFDNFLKIGFLSISMLSTVALLTFIIVNLIPHPITINIFLTLLKR